MQRRIRDLLQMPDGSLLVIEDAKAGALLRLRPGGWANPRPGGQTQR